MKIFLTPNIMILSIADFNGSTDIDVFILKYRWDVFLSLIVSSVDLGEKKLEDFVLTSSICHWPYFCL